MANKDIRRIKVGGQVYNVRDERVDTLHQVAYSGNYNDLTNKPTIPTVNDGKLTLTVNNNTANKVEFTANQAGTSDFNVNVPERASNPTSPTDTTGYTTPKDVADQIADALTGRANFRGLIESAIAWPPVSVGNDPAFESGDYWVVKDAGNYPAGASAANQKYLEAGDMVFAIKKDDGNRTDNNIWTYCNVVQSNFNLFDYMKKDGNSGLSGIHDFTGATVNVATPTANSNAATKKYVDDGLAKKVNLNTTNSVGSNFTIDKTSATDFSFITKGTGTSKKTLQEVLDDIQADVSGGKIKDYSYISGGNITEEGYLSPNIRSDIVSAFDSQKIPVILVQLTYGTSNSNVIIPIPLFKSAGTTPTNYVFEGSFVYAWQESISSTGENPSEHRRSVSITVVSNSSSTTITSAKNYDIWEYDKNNSTLGITIPNKVINTTISTT